MMCRDYVGVDVLIMKIKACCRTFQLANWAHSVRIYTAHAKFDIPCDGHIRTMPVVPLL